MHIKADGLIEKASRLKEGEVEFVVSTNAWDAHGERINVDGIDIKVVLNNIWTVKVIVFLYIRTLNNMVLKTLRLFLLRNINVLIESTF